MPERPVPEPMPDADPAADAAGTEQTTDAAPVTEAAPGGGATAPVPDAGPTDRADAPEEAEATQRMHFAAVLEDRVLAFLGAALRRVGGWLPRVEAYTGLGTPRRVRVLGRVMFFPRKIKLGTPEPVERGFRNYLTVPAPLVPVRITLGSTEVEAVSDRNGYVDVEIDLPEDAPLEPGWRRVTLRTVDTAGPDATGTVLVVGDDVQLGVVSDIDDTAMVTAVPRVLVAAWNALWVRTAARRAVRGMPGFYARMHAANPDAPFVYLSSGAWNTALSLRRFLARNGFPAGPLLLTDFGPTATGWFRSGEVHKTTSLERLISTYPHVRWVLVGDDGQHDPEVYAQAAQAFPDNVAAIAIRTLTTTERVLATGTALPGRLTGDDGAAEDAAPSAVPFVRGGDGDALAAELEKVSGLLAPRAEGPA